MMTREYWLDAAAVVLRTAIQTLLSLVTVETMVAGGIDWVLTLNTVAATSLIAGGHYFLRDGDPGTVLAQFKTRQSIADTDC